MRKLRGIFTILCFIFGCGGNKVVSLEVSTSLLKKEVLASSPKLSFSQEGIPYIVFVNKEKAQVELAVKTEKGWEIVMVPVSYPTLEIGKSFFTSRGIFSFSAYTFGKLTLFQKTATGWISRDVDAQGDTGLNSDVIEDNEGGFHFSYINNTALDLIYTRLYMGENQPEMVDPGYYGLTGGGEVFSSTSITLDRNLMPHISYYEGFHGVLKHAYLKEDKSGWVIEVVDSESDRGRYNSISYSKVCDCLHIAYYDAEKGNLLFAEKKESWKIETVDSSPLNVGKAAKLIDLSDGRILIFYLDATNSALRIGVRTAGGWNLFQMVSEREDGCPVLVAEFDAAVFSERVGVVISDSLNREVRYIEESLEKFR